MKVKFFPALAGAVLVVVIVVVAVVIFTKNGAAQKPPALSDSFTDPQMLMIPRWFLRAMAVDGKPVEIPADQQRITIQFTPAKNANGKGGCNEFSTTYQAGSDGKMHFEPVISTKMACEDFMQQESAYFTALEKVTQFKIEAGKLFLSSADGQTTLMFAKPPK